MAHDYDINLYDKNDLPLSTQVEYLGHGESEKEIHLRDYLNVILRRKWTVFFCLIFIVTTVTFARFTTKSMYKSTVTIRIDKENPNVLTFKDVYQIEQTDQEYYQTQYKIIKSRTLAKKVIKELELDKHPDFLPDEDESFSIKEFIHIFGAHIM